MNIERPTSNFEWEKMKKQSLKPELLDDILQETEELIKTFVTSIKTAEKKPRLGVVECSLLDVCFSFHVGHSMFDVGRSSLETSPHGLNPPLQKGEAIGMPGLKD